MDRSTAARIGIAGAIAGAGLAAGGVAMAAAETGSPDGSTSPSAYPGGPRGDRGRLAETLAEELGLDQDRVETALRAVRGELRSHRADAAEAERAERQAALAEALAEELGVSEAKVTAALEVVRKAADADREERRADARTALVERLDDAIEAGTLTEADKASVLKAYDADLLRGGFGHRGPGGPRGSGQP